MDIISANQRILLYILVLVLLNSANKITLRITVRLLTVIIFHISAPDTTRFCKDIVITDFRFGWILCLADSTTNFVNESGGFQSPKL